MKYLTIFFATLLAGCADTTISNSVTTDDFEISRDGSPFYYIEHADYFELPDEDYPRLGFNFTVTYHGDAPGMFNAVDVRLENNTKRAVEPWSFYLDGEDAFGEDLEFMPGAIRDVTIIWTREHQPPYTVWFNDKKISYDEAPAETTWVYNS